MAAVLQITVFQPEPGRFDEFLKRTSKAKKIRERAGAKVRYYRTVSGGLPAIAAVAETGGWKAHGEYMAKLEADPEWQKLMAEVRADREPSAKIVELRMSEEIEV
ncbi:MAG: hypothetical protein WCA22_04225 [Candidatus Binatus sp.]